MSDVIKLLPDSVANQIAAGEVIQRPASVVKELVENAIDAGATAIQIHIKDAGRTLIQVVDNGKGMSPTDARLSFERHATSKIRCADDLFQLDTMGFRGEALASIAAISQVELRTRTAQSDLGTLITLAASTIEQQEPLSCDIGTSFSVKNIFFNVPARRKFLKNNQTELSNILGEFERIALVNTEVAFVVTHNDNELFNLAAGNLKQRIITLFGKSLNQQLLPVEADTSLIKISGYIGKPQAARKRNALQYLFVNNRYMRHPYFHKAVMQSYEQLLPVGEMPNYFLQLTVSPSAIDVNIHPTKTEIKFENEQPIWQIISAAVKEALGKFSAIPSIDFDMDDAPEIPVFSGTQAVAPPKTTFAQGYNPFKPASVAAASRPSMDWSKLYEGFSSSSEMPEVADTTTTFASKFNTPTSADTLPLEGANEMVVSSKINNPSPATSGDYLQMKGRYILTSVKSGLMMIDQHRAHQRVLFDRYLQQIEQQKGVSQRMLFPEMVEFSSSHAAILAQLETDLAWLGFDLSHMGGGSYAVNAIPAGIEGLNISNTLHQMVDTALHSGLDVKSELHQTIAQTLAQQAAIPYGQQLSGNEMEQLVDELFASPMPNFTPDGKPTLSLFASDEIEKRFK